MLVEAVFPPSHVPAHRSPDYAPGGGGRTVYFISDSVPVDGWTSTPLIEIGAEPMRTAPSACSPYRQVLAAVARSLDRSPCEPGLLLDHLEGAPTAGDVAELDINDVYVFSPGLGTRLQTVLAA